MKIIIINHTFQKIQFSKRWHDLAKDHADWDITLLAPSEWTWGSGTATTFGKIEKKKGYDFDDSNFHIRKISIKKTAHFGWTSGEMIDEIDRIQPDVVYHIGSHTQESLIQILKHRKKTAGSYKVFAFSMRGPQQNITNIFNLQKHDKRLLKKFLRLFQYMYEKKKVKTLNKLCDAIFCHYPDGRKAFIDEGYTGPIFMQTQVGVDTSIFYPDSEKRASMRKKLGINDTTYVFASAVRFNPAKGVLQVLDSLPSEGDWVYLLMGSGLPEEEQAVRLKIKERNLSDKVILPGFIEWEDMPAYWNAADCAIHFTQTTPTWIETFSLSLVQAMATSLPVIGSSSGSVPYQIGSDGIIVDERNTEQLNEKIRWVINHKEESCEIGKKLYYRTVRSFSTKHLNELFYYTINQLLNGIVDEDSIDMANSSIE